MLHSFAFECYFCGKVFARADRQKRHVENCSGIPGIVYNFSNQNLVTFEDNLKYKGDLPMVIYLTMKQLPLQIIVSIQNKKKCLLCHML